MSKPIDWDKVARQQKGQMHGTLFAYDELPSVGSWADQQRVASRKKPKNKATTLGINAKVAPSTQAAPTPFAPCPLCGNLVGKMKRHLRRAHGAKPGNEHETPTTAASSDQTEP